MGRTVHVRARLHFLPGCPEDRAPPQVQPQDLALGGHARKYMVQNIEYRIRNIDCKTQNTTDRIQNTKNRIQNTGSLELRHQQGGQGLRSRVPSGSSRLGQQGFVCRFEGLRNFGFPRRYEVRGPRSREAAYLRASGFLIKRGWFIVALAVFVSFSDFFLN